MTKNVGIIGLGVMGCHIASHLIKKKSLHILDRKSQKTKSFIKKYRNSKNFTSHKNLDELSSNCSFIITCVGDDKDLEDIFFKKKGILDGLKKNTIVVDHTTASLKITRKLYKKLLKNKCFFLTRQ